MDTLARCLFLVAMVPAAAPTAAQTYGSTSPFCVQSFGIGGGGIDCSYASMDQCRASASGRAAECITNPYFPGAPDRVSVGRRRR